MGFLDLSVPECTQTDLNHSTVVQDLGQRVGVVDRILEKEKETTQVEPQSQVKLKTRSWLDSISKKQFKDCLQYLSELRGRLLKGPT